MKPLSRTLCFSIFLPVFGLLFSIICLEGILRIKNLSMGNYEIEMWRYANELKVRSSTPKLGHEHKPLMTATLQSVDFRLNEFGIRGPSLRSKEDHHRVLLFLGSSITLGWGVREEDTMTSKIEEFFRKDNQNTEVLNAGIGNYNSERYVELFFSKLRETKPTDVVVHYFLRDAEVLEAGGGNWTLQNSQLAVTAWNIFHRLKFLNQKTTVDSHYPKLYNENGEGFQRMKAALARLSSYCKENGIRIYLAMTPDIHNLTNYPFEGIHRQISVLAEKLGFEFIDLLPALRGMKPNEIWSLPNDPHPNAIGHLKMAEAIYPVLRINHKP